MKTYYHKNCIGIGFSLERTGVTDELARRARTELSGRVWFLFWITVFHIPISKYRDI